MDDHIEAAGFEAGDQQANWRSTDKLHFLNSLDPDTLIDAKGHPAHPDQFRHLDGTSLSMEEISWLGSVSMSEVSEWITQIQTERDQAQAELDATVELKELVEAIWGLHPGLSLHEVIQRLPEPERSRAIELVSSW